MQQLTKHISPGPCITNIIATCRKNFSQWESSFLWKLRCHWLKFLRRVAKTLVIQGPGALAQKPCQPGRGLDTSWRLCDVIVVCVCILQGPILLTCFNLIPVWICDYIHYKSWDEITYPFPNFNGATVEVWEWVSNFISRFTRHVITYPYWV